MFSGVGVHQNVESGGNIGEPLLAVETAGVLIRMELLRLSLEGGLNLVHVRTPRNVEQVVEVVLDLLVASCPVHVEDLFLHLCEGNQEKEAQKEGHNHPVLGKPLESGLILGTVAGGLSILGLLGFLGLLHLLSLLLILLALLTLSRLLGSGFPWLLDRSFGFFLHLLRL